MPDWRYDRVDRPVGALELLEAAHELHEVARFQDDQPAVSMVVRKGPEGFVTQRDLRTERPGCRRVERDGARERHG